MVWTTPMTAVSGQPFSAGQFNRYIRDNLNELAAAKATAAGQYFVADNGNSISGRVPDADYVATSQTTTSTAYTDLATAGPTVTAVTGANVLIWINATISNSAAANQSKIGLDISGAYDEDANDYFRLMLGGQTATIGMRVSMCRRMGTITPGTNVFQLKYAVSAGTGTFSNRELIVLPL